MPLSACVDCLCDCYDRVTLILLYNVWTQEFPGSIRDKGVWVVNRPGDLNRSSASTGPGYLVGLALLVCRVWLRSGLPAAHPPMNGLMNALAPTSRLDVLPRQTASDAADRLTSQPLEPASTTHVRTHWLRRRSRLRWAGTCANPHTSKPPPHLPPLPLAFLQSAYHVVAWGTFLSPSRARPAAGTGRRPRNGRLGWGGARKAGRQTGPGAGAGSNGVVVPAGGRLGDGSSCSLLPSRGWVDGWMDGWMDGWDQAGCKGLGQY